MEGWGQGRRLEEFPPTIDRKVSSGEPRSAWWNRHASKGELDEEKEVGRGKSGLQSTRKLGKKGKHEWKLGRRVPPREKRLLFFLKLT